MNQLITRTIQILGLSSKYIIILLLLTLFILPVEVSSSTSSKHPLVLDFLMVGDLQGWVNHLGDDEPSIDITLVPARAFGMEVSDEYLHRLNRIYFPRNKEALFGHNVLFFNHPRLDFFTPQQQAMMVDFSSTEGKVPIAFPLSRSYEEVQVPWLNSPISGVFPVDMERFAFAWAEGIPDRFWGSIRLRLVSGLPPVFGLFENTGIFEARIYTGSRPCYAKEGATIWLYMLDGPREMPEAPAFVSWPYGDSDAWAFGLHPGWENTAWAEAGDWWELIFLNICFYTSGREILTFEEAVDKRSVKIKLAYFRNSASLFRNIVDFVSKVGANTNQAERTLSEAYRIKSEAETESLEQRYEEAGEKMDEALQLIDQAMDEAQQAKDAALFWIYIAEWLITTAAILISGVVLWWLMVRRSLYREVITTQLR
jgi:hypothetical protein